MIAATHPAPQDHFVEANKMIAKPDFIKIVVISRTGTECPMAVEFVPGQGYRMPLVTLVNFWDIYSHMHGKFYPTVEAFLDDAAEGWQSWRPKAEKRFLTNTEESSIIKQALLRAGIHPKSVRHSSGPVIIIMGRPEAHEGEFLDIETLAWQALDAVPDTRNGCLGIHVREAWAGKLKAGYPRFRKYKN